MESHSEYRFVFRRLRRNLLPWFFVVGIPELGSRDGKSLEAKLLLLFLVCFSAALGIRRRGCDDERRGRAGICQRMSSCEEDIKEKEYMHHSTVRSQHPLELYRTQYQGRQKFKWKTAAQYGSAFQSTDWRQRKEPWPFRYPYDVLDN